MINNDNHDRQCRAWLVRTWQVCCDGQTVWRASAEDAHSGERRAFADLAQLFVFLEETTLSGQITIQHKEHLP